MSSNSHVKNIAIVGASGLVGGAIFSSLLESGNFNLTAISRQESTATFPSGVTVKKGDYSSSDFLESALQGQDVLIITLAVTAAPEVQTVLISAAARAGVPWVLPNEYGGDGENVELCKAVFVLGIKAKYRNQIEELGKSSWIGIASSLWFDYSLKGGHFGIDIPQRKANIWDDGTNTINTTTIAQVGRAVARLLSLPIQKTPSSPAALSDYKNKFVCINSFLASQKDIIAAAQRATNTQPEEWTITTMPLDRYIQQGHERVAKGDRMGMINVLYGSTFKKGLGDRYHGKELANEKLGLQSEDIDDAVKRVVETLEAK